MTWGVALALAVLWPGRVIGPLDGAPLDSALEALVVALALPFVWLLHPSFLRTRTARVLVITLLAWKAATALCLTQGGWCGEFLSPYPPPGTYRLERSWDARTYWTRSPPGCTAIVSRSFATLADFPGWIINVPYDWTVGEGWALVPIETPKPPDGVYQMLLSGVFRPTGEGTLTFELGQEVQFEGSIDGRPLPSQRSGAVATTLGPGEHAIAVQLLLAGSDWRFIPRWDNRDVFAAVPTGLRPATALDRAVDGWGHYVAAALVLMLVGAWVVAAARAVRLNRAFVAWIAFSTTVAIASAWSHSDDYVRFGFVMLLGAAAVPLATHLRNWRGLLVLLGVPWFLVFAMRSLSQVGRFAIYNFGDDWTTFERFAFKIFMQGYWLQGGEHKVSLPSGVFWQQPLYRWIVGVLHLVFGDSSVGELYWDVVAVFIGAVLSFEILRRFAGFRTGVAGGALTLATIALGPNWYIIGRGLSEITALGWIGLAALALMEGRSRGVPYAVLGGVCAVLAFYTRLNHLPLLFALVALTLPDDMPAAAWLRWRFVWSRVPKRVAGAYLACAFVGVGAFAARTSYYAGRLTLFAGQHQHLATGIGLNPASTWSLSAWKRAAESVLMIVTVQDPPRLDPRSLLVFLGVAAALLAVARVPLVRRLPLGLVVVCLGAVAGGIVARGVAYPGRFSIHLIPIAVAVSVSVVASATGAEGTSGSRQTSRLASAPASGHV